jgi:hypothetical protein
MAKKVTPTGEVETPEKCLVPYLTSPQIRHRNLGSNQESHLRMCYQNMTSYYCVEVLSSALI